MANRTQNFNDLDGVRLVAGSISVVKGTFTRQANTTAYTAGQVVSDGSPSHLIAFPNVTRLEGGTGYITGVRLKTNQAGVTPQFRLYLYTANESQVSVPADAASRLDAV